MLKSRCQDYGNVLKGLRVVANNFVSTKLEDIERIRRTSSNINDLKYATLKVESFLNDRSARKADFVSLFI